MKFKFLKNKEKPHKNAADSNSDINERTREKFILKGWIESNRKPTCTKNGTRGFLCRLHKLVLNGKMTFSCPTTCTDSYTRRENRCQIPFKTSLARFKMDFSAGRSMVEMLGVLAIIGVLSIGGISGYTVAMRRYRANEIINIATKYAMTVYSACQIQIYNEIPQINYSSNSNYIPYIDAVGGAWHCNRIPFNEAGLGKAPHGAYIDVSSRKTAYNLGGVDSIGSGLAHFASGIRTKDQNDYIYMPVGVTDKNLCETISAIAGNTGVRDNAYSNCERLINDFTNEEPVYATLVRVSVFTSSNNINNFKDSDNSDFSDDPDDNSYESD